jgi:AraC-like DNA-binding protein
MVKTYRNDSKKCGESRELASGALLFVVVFSTMDAVVIAEIRHAIIAVATHMLVLPFKMCIVFVNVNITLTYYQSWQHCNNSFGVGKKRRVKITKNLSKRPPSINKMAEMAGMSVTKFKVMFKETFGESPHQYILDKKLFLAKELLQTGQYSITEVSYKIGFNYPSGFTRVFKNKFQYPPSLIYTNKNALLKLVDN